MADEQAQPVIVVEGGAKFVDFTFQGFDPVLLSGAEKLYKNTRP